MTNTMNLSSQFRTLTEFLAKHSAKNIENPQKTIYTHTRMKDVELGIFPGSYIISSEDTKTFNELYYDHIFVKKRKEYLTEVQLQDGYIAVDFDFRYNYNVVDKQHSPEHIQDMVGLYLEVLKENFVFEENKPFDIFLFEKPHVNRVEDKSLTKDGIHMLIGIKTPKEIRTMIREKVLEKISDVWGDLPIENNWDSVIDKGVCEGGTNWMLYGSCKPKCEVYELNRYFVCTYDNNQEDFSVDEKNVEKFDIKHNFEKLSVRYTNLPSFEIHPNILEEYNKRVAISQTKPKKSNSKTKFNLLNDTNDTQNPDDNDDEISLSSIVNKDRLEQAINIMLRSLRSEEYKIREVHEMTLELSEKYYEPGSHMLNRQVAFALKGLDERMFITWVALRSKASDFNYASIPSLYSEWSSFKKQSNNNKTVTYRSIKYWLKEENYEAYCKIKNKSVEHFVNISLSINGGGDNKGEFKDVIGTDSDLADVLRAAEGDNYVCVSYEKKGIWYRFKGHRWVQDKGISLREKISKDLFNIYTKKQEELIPLYGEMPQTDPRHKSLGALISNISILKGKLKQTTHKNNIMREASEKFYDDDFVKKMDTNKYLMCFNNGVLDFKNKIFRDGRPNDYITKCTGINYVPYNENDPKWHKTAEEIRAFFKTIFPIPDLEKYMWEHLASTLIGENKNQTFNVYHGSGSNGKSIITDLMSATLGEYKGIVPIGLVTEKRVSIGQTSDEILKLKGVRYAVMQEPSKGQKLNEGKMKELTGGDPIQARGLFLESEVFESQFTLVVCTNNLFDIESTEDGTWRRVRRVVYPSKFIDDGEEYHGDNIYIFKKDKDLKDKIRTQEFAEVFASMLAKIAFETEGIVSECNYVLDASRSYRKSQDNIAAFIEERIEKTGNPKDRIMKTVVAEEFKRWMQQNFGSGRTMPKATELYECLDAKFSECTKKGWLGVKLISEENDDDDDDLLNL